MKLNLTSTLAALVLGLTSAAFAAEGVPADYPLKKCPVSGEALGEHGKPVKVSNDGTDVYLCCKSCKKDFDKEPTKYTSQVKDAKKS